MKTKGAILFLIILAVFFCVPLDARERIIDRAGLLKSADKKELLSLINSVSTEYNFDLVIVTEKNIGKVKPKKYADDFFDKNGYGHGKGKDGCLFLQVTGSRDYWFSTSGRGTRILFASGLNRPAAYIQGYLGIDIRSYAPFKKLEKDAVELLKKDDPAGAYKTFINNWEEFLKLDAQGKVYNTPLNVLFETLWLMGGLGIVLIILVSFFGPRDSSSGGYSRDDRDYDSDSSSYDSSSSDSSSSDSSSSDSDSGSHGGGGGTY